MDTISLLARIDNPDMVLLERMIQSVLNQTDSQWELVLVVPKSQPIPALSAAPNLRIEVRPDDELLAWSAEALLPTLGRWLGFIGQHDQLAAEALAKMRQALVDNPAAKVAFSDEESVGRWNQKSLKFLKQGLNPTRLVYQEYLRDLALIDREWIQSHGGFPRLYSDRPTHAVYLSLLDTVGPTAFCHVPEVLYLRFRDRLSDIRADPRRLPWMVDYDLQAIKDHLVRRGIPADVTQLNGTVVVTPKVQAYPMVTALVVLGEDVTEGLQRLQALRRAPMYQPMQIKAIYPGAVSLTVRKYEEACKGMQVGFMQATSPIVETLNQEISQVDSELVLLLQGTLVKPGDMQAMVNAIQMPHVDAVGATVIAGAELTEPGTAGYQYEGASWNSRGRFNLLSAPHHASVLSPVALLLKTRRFNGMGGFDTSYPMLYGMDYTLRLSAVGTCVCLPDVVAAVTYPANPPVDELASLRSAWAGWEDPYGLHQFL